MSKVGQIERITQNRVVDLLRDSNQLNYKYLGNWERRDNRNIEEATLRNFLQVKQGYRDELIKQAIDKFKRVAGNQVSNFYDVNKEVYDLLRYGVKIKMSAGENFETVWLIDWENAENNDFAFAQEVTVKGQPNEKRPDIVLYVNGIALAVLELKRSIVDVTNGIRQNIESQQPEYIQSFFTTVQLVMAGNDTKGLYYGTTQTEEKQFDGWKKRAASKTCWIGI